jgi:hypothetical protein
MVVALPNKRDILQSILDMEDDLWIIMKPSLKNPTDAEYLCVFQNPAKCKEARAEIPTTWFENREFDKIKGAVRDALDHAEFGYKYT